MKNIHQFRNPTLTLSAYGKAAVRVHVAAHRFGCSPRTIRRMIQNGVLPAYRLNRRAWAIPSTAIAVMLEMREVSCFR